jgi:diguanylate cyclase (GGDEF)-like protein
MGVAEAMVTQATVSATLDDMTGLRSLLEMSTRRNDDVRSVALRDVRGRVLMATHEHSSVWADAPSEGSSSSHIRMPIFKDGARWATLELGYALLTPRAIATGILARPSTRLISAMAVIGFLANFVFVKRILKHLDPSEVVPTRVQTALDVMADGVLLIDVNERIVLANSAFCEQLNQSPAALLGLPASSLGWQMASNLGHSEELPWLDAIAHGEAREDVPISIVPEGDTEALEYRVSGSPVLDGWSHAKGAIVTFKDVTMLERQRRELEGALTQLEKSQDEIRLQNEELELLAQTDSLTGLANRRTFMAWYDEQLAISRANDEPLSCLMVDIDFFKKVNDDHGHAMGDEVICRVADVLKDHTRSADIAGRYGGEEFCVAFLGLDVEAAMNIAESIRATIAAPGFARIPITVSIGVSSTEFGATTPSALIEEADESLYESKNAGRNRSTRFDEIAEQTVSGG